jgi:ATP-dependent Clp protease adaptor protein ClpS
MTETETTVAERTDIKIKMPGKYKVILLNDDRTPIDFVISLLMEIFGHTKQRATEITLNVHNTGKGVAGVYSYEIAEQKIHESTNVSRINGFPLTLELEEE